MLQAAMSNSKADVPRCPMHRKKLKLYCNTCQSACCSACVSSHKEHAFQEITEVDEDLKSELREVIGVLEQLVGKVNGQRERVSKSAEEIQRGSSRSPTDGMVS